ncbi:MAG: phosphoserine phosphatase SerB [Alphaproteobacteria bacterium]|nr:phosphoserine phosphatase SerB [Alphaproteobacteria bacterium]
MFVVTLISPSSEYTLDEVSINRVFKTIEKSKGGVENISWLCKDEACDIFFNTPADIAELGSKIRQTLHPHPIDAIVQPVAKRRKKMLIADMDSTMIKQECIDEIADFVGAKERVAAITERAMNGELDFKEALQERVALLKGLPAETLQRVYSERIIFMDGAKTLISTMRKHGSFCVLVSGGFTFFTSRVSESLGFHTNEANILEIEHDALTGTVKEPILDKTSKVHFLEHYAKNQQLGLDEIVAIGDGANDIPMLLKAGLGIAYHAKPIVQEQARACINHNDLTALLYIQGYKKGEFITNE